MVNCSINDWDEKIVKYKQIKFKGKKIMNNLEINNESFIKDFRSSRIAVRCRTHTEALAFIDFLNNNNIQLVIQLGDFNSVLNFVNKPCEIIEKN